MDRKLKEDIISIDFFPFSLPFKLLIFLFFSDSSLVPSSPLSFSAFLILQRKIMTLNQFYSLPNNAIFQVKGNDE